MGFFDSLNKSYNNRKEIEQNKTANSNYSSGVFGHRGEINKISEKTNAELEKIYQTTDDPSYRSEVENLLVQERGYGVANGNLYIKKVVKSCDFCTKWERSSKECPYCKKNLCSSCYGDHIKNCDLKKIFENLKKKETDE